MTRSPSSLLLLWLLLGVGAHAPLAAETALPPLPPLNDPATDTRLPGKFIWADLFTNDVTSARQFYADVFGWEWRWISEQPEHLYGMFYSDGIAMAGVAHHEAPDEGKAYGRWVYYISADNVEKAIQGATERGGRTLLKQHSITQRGDFAILADPEDAPFGVMRSSSGDPPDYRAEFSEWLWVGFFSRNTDKASQFYASLFGYDVRKYDERADVIELILEASGHARAGVGQLSPESEAEPTWLGFVRVEDLDATIEKARVAGGEILYSPENEGAVGDIAIIADPFGATVGLMTWTFEEKDDGDRESRP